MEISLHKLAEHLGLSASTITRWVRQGKIPVNIKKNICRFNKNVLIKWTEQHNIQLFQKTKELKHVNEESQSLVNAIKAGGVIYNITGNNSETVFVSATEKMTFLPAHLKTELYEKLIKREQMTSTGVGKGVAVPHPRNPIVEIAENPLITTCFLDKPVDFNAIDSKPVFVLFILLCPTLQIHLHLLSRLSFCLRNDQFIRFLNTRPKAEELYVELSIIEKILSDEL